ncbi:hypothetical protein GYMLUDRAFT_264861 [Collybiopsis luxurians FD-317 M1]|uniref:G-protein coupled receptors family 1 profile domain-containing protein n=1 Tax=Collybiopsis luxurians FD-317 M1 TaxID=944289 RepID=A0A0D0BH20_9AGAR|nr:hypothetical protein GYMLUDRAFT_264861 [Collybiopsis luxurians FD-317 M1]
MSNATVSAFSPAIPFHLLPPEIAYQCQIDTYIVAGTLAIFIWDVLSNLSDDWRLFRPTKNNFVLAAYVISRISSLAYVAGRMVEMTYPVGNCKLMDTIIGCFFPAGIAGSCVLFFLRARAIYRSQKYMVALFAFLWVSVLAACLTIPFGTSALNIGDTPYCINIFFKGFTAASVIVPTIYDTVIFLAISYKLMSNSRSLAPDQSFRDRILGTNLPGFSRAMLQNGQKYYLVTLLSNLATILLAYAPVDPAYRNVLALPNTMLTNVMACYVYRKMVLCKGRDPEDIMDGLIIPTAQNTLPSTADCALTLGQNCNHHVTNEIVIEVISGSHNGVSTPVKSRTSNSLL